jgi:hypothetical protein
MALVRSGYLGFEAAHRGCRGPYPDASKGKGMVRSLLVIASLGLASSPSFADEPKPLVDFDTNVSFVCRDVTPKDFPAASPESKVVESSIRVSANFTANEKDIESIVYKIKLPSGVEIADYLPKTEVATDIASNIDRRQNNSSKDGMVVSLEAGGKVGFKLPAGFEADVSGSAGRKVDQNTEVTSAIQVSQLPPKQLVTAAGTEDRGQTIYFKLRPFSQKTLEGNRDFAILLIVPKAWSGDHVELRCLAWKKGFEPVVVEKVMDFALVMRGDASAKRRLEDEVRKTKVVLRIADPDSRNGGSTLTTAPKDNSPAAKITLIEGKYRFKYVPKDDKGAESPLEMTVDAVFAADGSWKGSCKIRGRENGGTTARLFNAELKAIKIFSAISVLPVPAATELSAPVRGTWALNNGSLTLIQTDTALGELSPWIEAKRTVTSDDPITNQAAAKDDIRLKSGLVLESNGHD